MFTPPQWDVNDVHELFKREDQVVKAEAGRGRHQLDSQPSSRMPSHSSPAQSQATSSSSRVVVASSYALATQGTPLRKDCLYSLQGCIDCSMIVLYTPTSTTTSSSFL